MAPSSEIRQILAAGGLLAVVAAGSVGPVHASGAAGNAELAQGKAVYREYCAVCHGNDGRGHGPIAKASKIHPTDLAALRRNNGSFPAQQIDAALRGDDPVVAHGAPGMMVWGALFLSDVNGNEAAAAATRRDVIAYIESMQEK